MLTKDIPPWDEAEWNHQMALRRERPCTCHLDDDPPKPCPKKYALEECRKAAASSGGSDAHR